MTVYNDTDQEKDKKKKKKSDDWLEAMIISIMKKNMKTVLDEALNDLLKGWH